MKSKKITGNKLNDTMYLSSTKANKKRLDDAITEMKKGKYSKHKLFK